MEQFANNPSTTLAAAIVSTSATTLTVSSSAGFPAVNFRILIDSELMKVTNISGTTWTVVRGDGGSTAATHLNAATVTEILTAEALNALVSVQANGTETSNRRVLNFIGASIADDSGNARANITVAGATYGTGSSKPSAGQAGRLYVPSDGAIISVDTGSTWIGLNPMGAPFTIPPILANWTEFNTTGATYTDIPGGGIGIVPAAVGSGDNLQGAYRSIASSTSYTITAAIRCPMPTNSNVRAGIFVGDGTKLLIFGPASWGGSQIPSAVLTYTSYTNVTTGNSNLSAGAGSFDATPGTGGGYDFNFATLWLRFVNDGTHRTLYFSLDGVIWIQFYQEAYNTYLTETVAGFFVDNKYATSGGTWSTALSLYSWSGA